MTPQELEGGNTANPLCTMRQAVRRPGHSLETILYFLSVVTWYNPEKQKQKQMMLLSQVGKERNDCQLIGRKRKNEIIIFPHPNKS